MGIAWSSATTGTTAETEPGSWGEGLQLGKDVKLAMNKYIYTVHTQHSTGENVQFNTTFKRIDPKLLLADVYEKKCPVSAFCNKT